MFARGSKNEDGSRIIGRIGGVTVDAGVAVVVPPLLPPLLPPPPPPPGLGTITTGGLEGVVGFSLPSQSYFSPSPQGYSHLDQYIAADYLSRNYTDSSPADLQG